MQANLHWIEAPGCADGVSHFQNNRRRMGVDAHGRRYRNNAYSKEVFEERMQKWRIKHNWQLPPMKTTVSPDEKRKGFYVAMVNDCEKTEVRYITPYSTKTDLTPSFDLTDEFVEMMWCLVHSRSDELVACKTVAEFKVTPIQQIKGHITQKSKPYKHMIFIIHNHTPHNHHDLKESNDGFCHECGAFVYFLLRTHHIVSCDNAHQMILYNTCVSCCTISAMSCRNVVCDRHPRTRSAFDASPQSTSTSVGR